MAAYDRDVIYEFANRLYSKAETVTFSYTIIGILLGGSACLFSKTSGVILAVIFGIIGFLIGNEKAFWYKLQAQVALCQAEIETNTAIIKYSNPDLTNNPPIPQSIQNTTKQYEFNNTENPEPAFTVVCQCGNPKMSGKACKKCGRT
jgi:hypothetical protein